MKKLVALAFLSSFSAFAQYALPERYDTLYKNHEIIINGSVDFGATAIHNEFQSKLLFGGFIDQENKNFAWGKHKGINRVGADIRGEFEYRNYKTNLFKKERYGWLIRGGYFFQGGMVYDKDLFGLTFFGNEQYLGENADFSGTRANLFSFQKLGFGVIDKKSKSNVAINLVTANQSMGVNLREASLYQNVDADSMIIIYDGIAQYQQGGFNKPGIGFSIDADFKIPIQILKNNVSFFQLSVRNLGGVFIPQTKFYSADSAFIFQGLTYDQLFGGASPIDSSFSILDTLNVRSETRSMFSMLPVFFQVGKIVDELNMNKVQAFYGVRLFPTLYFIPQVYAGVNYKPIKQVNIGASASYGGFTNFRCGLYVTGNFKTFDIGLSTENLIGLVSEKGLGKSVALRFSWRI